MKDPASNWTDPPSTFPRTNGCGGSSRRVILAFMHPKPAHADARTTGEPPSAESLFLAHLSTIDRIVAILCARHGLTGADAEDFGAWVRMRIMEDDYAMLRKFSGRSSMATYLSVAIANLHRDHRVRKNGRWRPSAAANRLGLTATRLEFLIYRRRMGFREAVSVLREEGTTSATDRELAELLAELPVRTPLRPDLAGDASLGVLPSSSEADAGLEEKEARLERERIVAALAEALESLDAEDQVVLRMRMWDETSVADIARSLSLPQKPLYRRLNKLFEVLREKLEERGVTAARVSDLLSSSIFPSGETPWTGPSNE